MRSYILERWSMTSIAMKIVVLLMVIAIVYVAGQEIVCVTTERVAGPTATCPPGYTVTGCSAGEERGSIRHFSTYCLTDDPKTDWTEARCCRIEWALFGF